MFVVDQATGQFLWARPFPYDDPNINMNDIDVKTGATQRQRRQAVQEGRRPHHRLLSQHARPVVQIAYDPRQQLALRAVPGSMPVDDGEREKPGRLGTARGRHAARASIPNKYMNIGKIDIATGEMKVLYSQPQASARLRAGHRRRSGVLGRPEPPLPRLRCRQRQGAVGDGRRRHGDEQHHHLRGERQAICDGLHRRRPVTYHRPFAGNRQAMPPAVRNASGVYVFALP